MTIEEAHKCFQRRENCQSPTQSVSPVFITMHMLVIFGAPCTKQGTWMPSGTGSSGCKNKDFLPILTARDCQGSLDKIIEEVNSCFSCWISYVASTGLGGDFLCSCPCVTRTSSQAFPFWLLACLEGLFPVLSESMDGGRRSWISACLFTAGLYTQLGMASYVPVSLFIGLDHSVVRKEDTSLIDELCKSLFQHPAHFSGISIYPGLHICTVVSKLDEAMRVPSGDQAVVITTSVWPL